MTYSPDKIREAFAIVGDVIASDYERRLEEAPEDKKNIITVKEAAKLLEVSESHVYVLYHGNKIKGMRVGVKALRIFKNSFNLPKPKENDPGALEHAEASQ